MRWLPKDPREGSALFERLTEKYVEKKGVEGVDVATDVINKCVDSF